MSDRRVDVENDEHLELERSNGLCNLLIMIM